MIYLRLFLEFFKTGLFAVGGGLATIPFLYDMADKNGWFTRGELSNMIAVAESTPGPIGVNMATYAGVQTAGISGGIVATLGLILPSLIIILIIAKVLDKFKSNKIVGDIFYGIRPVVSGLVAAAAVEMTNLALFDPELFLKTKEIFDFIDIKAVIMFVVFLVLTRKFKKIHPLVFIISAGVLGALLKM